MIWIANQVHNIDFVRHGAVSNAKGDPTWHRTFLGKTQPRSFFRVEKLQIQAKLALIAKENIALDTLLEPKPENVQLPLEPIYENTITGSWAQLERERLARKAQLKMSWENRCQKQIEIGVMCGDKPWIQADRRTVYVVS